MHFAEETPTDTESTLDTLGKPTPSGQSRSVEVAKPKSERNSYREPTTPVPAGSSSTRVVNLPNALSFLRILMVPLFLWLVLVPELDGIAIGVLVLSGFTDYLDGKIARATGQITSLGALLDPVADRLFILAVVIGLGMREIIPWWLALSLPLRDVLLLLLVPFLRTRGFSSLPVHFLGKAATAVLLYAFPLLLLGDATGAVANLARVFGWAFSIWGVALYWWAGLLYVVQVRQVFKSRPRQSRR